MESFATQIIMATSINKTLQNEKMHIPKTNALFVSPKPCNILVISDIIMYNHA